ncbi:MAG: HAD family hydrolase [Proteobacteria bacterium]|nr:HAD family hydrolase [Pseudomonadota bacterium]
MSHRDFRNIVFDLDGTLVDSFPGIVASMNHAVSVIDPSLDLSDLKSQIGPPLPKMLLLMWPDLAEEVRASVLAEFRSDYNNRGYQFSVAYTGIPEALHQFRSSGITLFVLTNKPEAPTRKILSHLGLEAHFTRILSPDSMNPPLSSKSEGALHLVKAQRLVANETLLVGDSPDDLKAARAAGFSFMEASYGYGNFDEIVTNEAWFRLKSPSDLAKLIN